MKRILIAVIFLFLSASVYSAVITIKSADGRAVATLKLSSGTTYNIYDVKGVKVGAYKSPVKLTATSVKNKKFRLVKVGTTYTIKE